jgi:NAD(P)-dependent dehydrogenase (short-subunit alcohol dehydrogenase family)
MAEYTLTGKTALVTGVEHAIARAVPLLPGAESERERLLRYIPNHRLGQPDDLATLTVYLASSLGGNMTGQVVYIEGGVMSHP